MLVAGEDQREREIPSPVAYLLMWDGDATSLGWDQRGLQLPVINHEHLEEPTETDPSVEG